MSVTTTPLRWAGSKRKSLEIINKYWLSKDFKTYVEPFSGSAAFHFYANPDKSIISDINSDLINFWQCLRDSPIEIYEIVSSFRNDKDEYYNIRSSFNCDQLDKVSRASYFLYLNRFCFNGLWRVNKSGGFNVPYGGQRAGRMPDQEMLLSCSARLRNALLYNEDFQFLENIELDKDTMVYLDPPYQSSTRRSFVEYSKVGFNQNDENRVMELLNNLDARGISFLMSYRGDFDDYNIPGTWSVEFNQVIRNVGGFSKSRKMDSEIFISNMVL
ncbi:hypothetical protein A3746_01210 [Oleibacter sp. HI0075]|nr:hypothetical protein A3746_01210 [Oleibacter sp. HI0075]|tara:strand:+ start:334 stop:1149 length:816 start_codon:yes stop_codon:yes gene_type:complete